MTSEDYSARENTVWLFPLLITQFVVISIINVITITAFARIRHLRKRSTYLIINLTVADLLVGAVAGPLLVYRVKETFKDEENHGFQWTRFVTLVLEMTFPLASQVNLCLISLDRLHATLFPFRHCLIRKWFYFKVIVGSWFMAFLLASLMAGLKLNEPDKFSYAWASFSILAILVLAVSYVIIILNVKRSPHSQHHYSIHTERRLSMTLFIVTAVSVLSILPWAIYKSLPVDLQNEFSKKSRFEIRDVLAVIFISNSIVNPLVYAIRIQQFRKAIGNLVCETTEPSRVHR